MATSQRRADPAEVVAHPGASADVSEHTMAAYRHAIRLGADAVECDVRMTRTAYWSVSTTVRVHGRASITRRPAVGWSRLWTWRIWSHSSSGAAPR